MKKNICYLMVVFLLLMSFCSIALAHPNTEAGTLLAESHQVGYDANGYPVNDVCLGNEEVGWVAYEGQHTSSSSTIYYKFDSSVPTALRQKFVQGAIMWNSVVTLAINSNLATGTVTMGSIPYQAVAWTTGQPDSNGHYTSWVISIHPGFIEDPDSFNAIDAAHEIGHVLGLIDLYDNANINKLMYYSSASTATAPTESDKKGAKVILGKHGVSKPTNPHVWDYKHYGTDSSGNHLHVKYCTVCDGYHALSSAYPNTPDTALCTFTEAYTGNHYHAGAYHYYQYRKTCTVCGHSYTYYQKLSCSGPPCPTPQSVGDDDI